jgi:ketosteroid isomerase-like protein
MPEGDAAEWMEKLAIGDVIQRYSDAVSRNLWDAVEATFTADCVLDLVAPFPMRVEGGRAIRDALADRCTELDVLFQTSVGSVIELTGPDEATATTLVNEMAHQAGVFSMQMRGVYYDQLRKEDGAWRFCHRRFQGVYTDRTPLSGRTLIPRAELT